MNLLFIHLYYTARATGLKLHIKVPLRSHNLTPGSFCTLCRAIHWKDDVVMPSAWFESSVRQGSWILWKLLGFHFLFWGYGNFHFQGSNMTPCPGGNGHISVIKGKHPLTGLGYMCRLSVKAIILAAWDIAPVMQIKYSSSYITGGCGLSHLTFIPPTSVWDTAWGNTPLDHKC